MRTLPRKLPTVGLLVLTMLVSTGFGSSHQKVLDRVIASVTRMTGEKHLTWEGADITAQYSCTGFVVAPKIVMTAAHCVGDNMRSDGISATVIKADEATDLALLDVDTDKPALALSTSEVARGDNVTGLGYGYGWTRVLVKEVKVMLVDYAPPHTNLAPGIFVDGSYIGGMSGGPVVNSSGQVVGIVQQSVAGEAGYGVGTLLMRAFMLGL